MTPNAKPSEHLAVLATIDPSSSSAAQNSAWVSAANFHAFLAIIKVGIMTATGTLDAKFQQALDNAGTGAKDIAPAKAITQLLAAGGNNRQVLLNMKAADLDVEGQFKFIRLVVTAATAASLVDATLVGAYPRYEDGALFNQAGVAQVV